tara:strand:- start:250 stop:1398 length:1149 start_codon:yes stop_codon:yes gene_type:complete
MLHYNKPSFRKINLQKFEDIFETGQVTQGKYKKELEEKIINYTGANYACAVNNATSALTIAGIALDIKSNDIIWTTSMTFVATANAFLWLGAKVKLIDINNVNYLMDVDLLKVELKKANISKKLPKALVIVHFGKSLVNIDEIYKICSLYDIKIIEDASQAFGAVDKKMRVVGNCNFVDISILSFQASKSITCGEGGMVLTNNPILGQKLNVIQNQGIDKSFTKVDEPWRNEMVLNGFNFKISEFQCAIALDQLYDLEFFLERRACLSEIYHLNLADLPLYFQGQGDEKKSSNHLMLISIDFKELKLKKLDFYNYMLKNNVRLYSHYLPLHMHKNFKNVLINLTSLIESENFYRNTFSFPLHVDITEEDIVYVSDLVKTYIK